MLFIPLYIGSSLAQLLCGRDPHRYNHFERQAYLDAVSATAMANTRNT
jgi:hypothetical protein